MLLTQHLHSSFLCICLDFPEFLVRQPFNLFIASINENIKNEPTR